MKYLIFLIDQLLTVGWGSRESQFQGAGTLKKREAADLDRMPSSLLHNDDRRVNSFYIHVHNLTSHPDFWGFRALELTRTIENIFNQEICGKLIARIWETFSKGFGVCN